ncbi:DUF2339 domain-containing protein [Marinobacter sp. M-5]|uniref:DUF2339 domain-containing protein n=1 Tax=Marinobacter sp. M-5 TaxID=3081089 RepID=UPI00293C581B|nr:DUF2339 domain-containing protein [Marinobacter sp. M-5]MDV3502822.1 DUF2339 domain-containing protein [Marinobacter sp. M-5]
MEALLIIVVVGFALLVPVGSVLGFLAFRQRHQQARQVAALTQEVASLRAQVNQFKGAVPPASDPVPDEPRITPLPPLELDEPGEPDEPVATGSHPSPHVDRFFSALKEHWMVWLGGLSVALAGIFMVSHSISAGYIGPVQQLLLALISGLALHGGAEWLRRRHRGSDDVFAALAGGGSITLYAALLAGVHHYGLIGPTVGLTGLAAVSLGTMVLALLHGPVLAIMGLSGAYLVPLLVGGDSGNVAFVLAYSFLISLSSLLLMRYVFRDWLWYATVTGAVLWWLVASSAAPAEVFMPWYLAGLFATFALVAGRIRSGVPRLREVLLVLLALWGLSIGGQGMSDPLMLSWLLILPVAALVPQSRGALWYLPWGAVLASAVGWLMLATVINVDGTYRLAMPVMLHRDFVAYLMLAAVLTAGLGLWHWVRAPERQRWASFTLLAPVVWLVLGWLLIQRAELSLTWATATLILAGLYGVIAGWLERRANGRSGVVWAILAAHICYSLAAVMVFREASLTLALSVQFVSLTWLARRYRMPQLHLLLKLALALVVARLTFNPWLAGYDTEAHWSLWTYGGATLCAGVATWLAARNTAIRPWLEAATLHLLVLFLGAELRYWLYDGDIFTQQYSFTEAALNTLLWGALSLSYGVRARVSESLAWLYRLFSWVLLGLAGMSYLTLLTWHNPWWGSEAISATPVFNLLLLAYGAPVLLALAVSRFPQLAPRFWALCVAAAGFLLFTAFEIRQLWQGSDMALSSGVSEGELYSYSVVGMAYAIVAILYATGRHHPVLYKAGMALLGLVIGKIFLIDMSGLQGLWRVAAFMGLGLALLGLAWLYRRARRTSLADAPMAGPDGLRE